jgi:hypothetical protein
MSVTSRPVKGTGSEKRTGWFFDYYEQWSGLFGSSNWYDFTLIDIGGEYAPYSGRCELSVAVLGLRGTVTYVYSSKFNDDMHDLIDEIKEKRP